jgi:hypothetical protein
VTITVDPVAPTVIQGRPGATVISFSELDAGKQCPHKHQLSYKERWTQPKDERTAAGRGTMWHQIMDAHYTALKNADVSPRDAVDDQLIDFRKAGKDSDVINLLSWMYDGYVQKWGNDDEWEVLRVEYKCVVPLRYPGVDGQPGKLSEFDLKMIIDLVVRSRLNRRVWLIDHKSHAALPKDKDLELDDQFGLYTWGLRQLGHKVHGCIYNTARTKMNIGDRPGAVEEWERAKAAGGKPGQRPKPQSLDERFDRYLMTRTERETENLAQDALSTARTLYSPFNFGERHTNSDTCKWRCDYTEACLMGRKTSPERERQFLLDVGFVQNFERH